MAHPIHNLDIDVAEYFEFIIKGHSYRFRHLNTEEVESMKSFESDEEKTKDYLFNFISKVNDDAPDFKEVAKKMITPQWVKFREMIKAEFSS